MRIPFLKRFFAKEKSPKKPKSGAPRSVLHNAKEIGRFLQQYAEANSVIEGRINIDKKNALRFTTGIITVDKSARVIHMDTLIPEPANRNIAPGQTVHFRLRYLGIRTEFDCVLKETIETPRAEHLFEFPRGIQQIQLREAFRIRISTANRVRATLENAEADTWSGRVQDLSVTGARLQLRKLIQPEPRRGDTFSQCDLTLSDGQRISCGARIMHWNYDPHKDITTLGIQFIDMPPPLEHKLSRFLTDLQRKERDGGVP